MSMSLKWICENNIVESTTISKAEDILSVKFPKEYVQIIMKNDGGYPNPNRFDLDGSEEIFNNLLSFDEEDISNILDVYNDVKDRLIEKVIPFAEDPFGNLICFDYRNNNNEQPKVVFWKHEKAFNDKENAITFICNTFTEFLNMLHESEE